MPDKHAVLSASSSHRWLACPPSALLCAKGKGHSLVNLPCRERMHTALCEHKAENSAGAGSPKIRPKTLTYFDEEMADCTDMYAQYVMEQVAAASRNRCRDPIVLGRTATEISPQWVPEGFGTGDCVIVADETLTVIDIKYGVGILVNAAENNPQMMCYALGALALFDGIYDITESIDDHLPAAKGHMSAPTRFPRKHCFPWAEEVHLHLPAQLAAKGEGEYKAGSHCQFCKVKATCRKRAEYNLELARYDFEMPANLEDEEIEVILAKGRRAGILGGTTSRNMHFSRQSAERSG